MKLPKEVIVFVENAGDPANEYLAAAATLEAAAPDQVGEKRRVGVYRLVRTETIETTFRTRPEKRGG